MSAGDLQGDASRLSTALARLGLRAGDSLLYQTQTGLGLYPLLLACAGLGVRLRVADAPGQLGAAPRRGGTHGPKLVIGAVERPEYGPEWVTLDELRFFGRADDEGSAPSDRPCLATPIATPTWAIRPLRTRLALRVPPGDAARNVGEIIFRAPQSGTAADQAGAGTEYRTGEIGWVADSGTLVVAGKLGDIAVRGSEAVLLCDIDRLLEQHPSVRSSVTFREHGASPTEPVIAACATEVDAAEVRNWIAGRAGPGWVPDRVVT
ncbi:MAG: hypothetical protein JOZ05_20220, partial [Acetobacteraceae bacterium]|nr:hypothetical protein [Acetobacteraceae bacterium]